MGEVNPFTDFLDEFFKLRGVGPTPCDIDHAEIRTIGPRAGRLNSER